MHIRKAVSALELRPRTGFTDATKGRTRLRRFFRSAFSWPSARPTKRDDYSVCGTLSRFLRDIKPVHAYNGGGQGAWHPGAPPPFPLTDPDGPVGLGRGNGSRIWDSTCTVFAHRTTIVFLSK